MNLGRPNRARKSKADDDLQEQRSTWEVTQFLMVLDRVAIVTYNGVDSNDRILLLCFT